MTVGAVGAVGAVDGSTAVYAITPYVGALAAHAAPAVRPVPAVVEPFANPAIAAIGKKTSVLSGDSGLLVQSYGAVALIVTRLATAPVYVPPVSEVIPRVVHVGAATIA